MQYFVSINNPKEDHKIYRNTFEEAMVVAVSYANFSGTSVSTEMNGEHKEVVSFRTIR